MDILGVVPLEACLVMANIEENGEIKKIGVAGFYDPLNKIFIRMDGRTVSSDFNKSLIDFINKKYNK